MIEAFVFVAASIALVYLSRSSLRAIRSHGFYRFFAWEFILGLILLNARSWFRDPFSIHQIIAWILLILCTYLVVHGAYLLRFMGKPDERRKEEALLRFEKTSELVTVGVYRYIRHPLYGSLLFLAWGAFFKEPGLLGGALCLMATLCLVATARADERECLLYFGPAYEAYMAKTKMFVPFVF